MDSAVLLAFLLLGWAGAATAAEPSSMSIRVGGDVTLPVSVPKGQSLTNLLLRASSREEAVAIWMDSKDITVLSLPYANRVAFQEDQMCFTITNLSLADGGYYEISTSFTSASPTVLSRFLVAVFNITERTSVLRNDSCYLYLNCEAGLGPGQRVNYTWRDGQSGSTLSRQPWLTQVVHSQQKRGYTCLAQTPTAQSTFSLVLQHLCLPSTASPGPWALGSLLLTGTLLLLLF
ncbi:SLAM family member 9 [Erythrolamprus reginae]|uniref:SLAM family member 9 n=1 Tax=Erythrolamprus reginae TaxID=121349 RepID=UPI00396C5636